MRLSLLLALVFSAAASAQPGSWLPFSQGTDAVSITSSHITFDSDTVDGFSPLSNATFLEGRFGDRVQVILDLPAAYTAFDESWPFEGTESAFVLGNPYLGVETRLRSGVVLGIGARAPIVETVIDVDRNDFTALSYGASATSDRIGAFTPETATLAGTLGYEYLASSDVSIEARVIPQVLIPVTEGRDTELFGSYTLQLRALVGPAELSLGARGTGILTEDTGSASRFDHFVGIAGELPVGGLRPGIYAEIPVSGDFGNAVNAIVGIGVSVDLN